MKTIIQEIEVYRFEELSEKAQEKAYFEWLNTYDYFYGNDNEETLKEFCNIFGVNVSNWSYDSNTYDYRYICNTNEFEIERFTGIRLYKYIVNNFYQYLYRSKTFWSKGYKKSRKSKILKTCDCLLTGYYMDHEILDPIMEFLKKPDNSTLEYLIQQCLETFFIACKNDVENCQSFEAFQEDCDANNIEFLGNGGVYYG